MPDIILMCLEFMKTGLFAVGGGLATIPFLYEMSDTYGWFSHGQILDMLAISESTPGAIGINMSTYAGYQTGGVAGGILSTFALALPSVIVILIVARLLGKFKDNRFVKGGFYVLRPASTALVASAGFGVVLAVFFGVEDITFADFGRLPEIFKEINWAAIALFAVIFVLMRLKALKKVHPIAFIAFAAVMGIVLKL